MIHYDKKDETSFAIGTTLSFEALLRKGDKVHRVYVSPKQERDSTYDKLKQLCLSLKIPLIENNEKIFSSADKENVMVIAEFAKFETPLDPKKNHVVLVHPSNMGNLGTIMRSSAAFTAGGLAIIRPAADAFDPKTIRSSMPGQEGMHTIELSKQKMISWGLVQSKSSFLRSFFIFVPPSLMRP